MHRYAIWDIGALKLYKLIYGLDKVALIFRVGATVAGYGNISGSLIKRYTLIIQVSKGLSGLKNDTPIIGVIDPIDNCSTATVKVYDLSLRS